ncbi:MAG: FIST C-terminal domain-containing protein [Candidatus Omnitrophica bacterium]|nr:FIST C-terminal domain-containing protein [Candidatus Omnitrophota bacterium]
MTNPMVDDILSSVGWSDLPDAGTAGSEAARRALGQIPKLAPKLALVFGSSWLQQEELLAGIRAVLPTTPLLGESTAGEITPQGPASHRCVLVLFFGKGMVCQVGMSLSVDRAPRDAGQQLAFAATQGCDGLPRAGFLLLGDGLMTSYAEVIRGLQEVLGTGTMIAGGIAGDDRRFAQTYQYCNDHVATGAVAGVLFAGAVKIGVGSGHGFAPISKPRRITKASANILYELDQRPAASVYEEYFGADVMERLRHEGMTRQTIAYPLGIQQEATDPWLLRNVVSFGSDGSLLCSSEVREGAWLQLMIGSRQRALDAAQQAAQAAVRGMNRISCVLVFDSVIRQILLGSRYAAVEIDRIRDVIGTATPMAGCYTYGEQAPVTARMTADRISMQTGSVLVIAIGT